MIARLRQTPVNRVPVLWVGTVLTCPLRKRSDWAADTTVPNAPMDIKMSTINVKVCIMKTYLQGECVEKIFLSFVKVY